MNTPDIQKSMQKYRKHEQGSQYNTQKEHNNALILDHEKSEITNMLENNSKDRETIKGNQESIHDADRFTRGRFIEKN